MSDSLEEPWSDNPNAPQIPLWLHSAEQRYFAGRFIETASYGIVVTLFFQCMGALIDPTNNIGRGVKWGLVAHTTALFLFLTIPTALDLYQASTEFIDNRSFPGTDEIPPGPVGYVVSLNLDAMTIVFITMFPLNQWLADGLLLYRCWIIYSMNYWVMAFPGLLYLASVATGVVYIYNQSITALNSQTLMDSGTSYNSISLSLNVILTLMVITRLVWHTRNIRKAIGASDTVVGSYTTIVTMLVESYALYAVIFLLYMITFATNNSIDFVFGGFLGPAQVVAPYLIILRVAKQRALTSEMVAFGSGTASSIRFKSQTTTGSEEYLHEGDPKSSTQVDYEAPDKPDARAGSVIEEVPS